MTPWTRLLVPLLVLVALGGACAKEKTCSSDLALCSDRCTSLASDPANCGACGHACGAGESCYGGACLCPFPTTCGGACVDLDSDPAHCGACGTACAGALVCTRPSGASASCAATCAAGQTPCGRACVDLQTHRQNCGACGRTCGTNERCEGGRCLADLYVSCWNSGEVREATAALAPAGIPIAVPPGPSGLAWVGDLLAVSTSRSTASETLTMLRFDPPGLRQEQVFATSVPNPNIEYLAEHGGLLYVSHNSLGTLLVVTPAGKVVDEIRLVPSGAPAPNPEGIAFDGSERAFVALEGPGEVVVLDLSHLPSCAAGRQAPPCATEVGRVDLGGTASPGAKPRPARITLAGGRAFVGLWNLDAKYAVTRGNTGRVAVIRTDTLQLDADFAGTASGAIDLGGDCLNVADVAVHDGKLWVSCGAFTYPTISGSGLVAVDLAGTTARVLPMVAGAADRAPGALAFCGGAGYVGDRNSGTVWTFDPTAPGTALGAGVELCPVTQGYAFVSDLACGR